MLLVMGVLPQILVLGDTIIEKTAFVLKRPIAPRRASGTIRIHGRVRGYISGVVDAEIHGILQGSVSAMVETQGLEQLDLLPEAEEREEAPHET